MDTYDARHEMVTLPEAAALAAAMGRHLDRSSLLCYARAGRLPAHKRHGVWLTTRAAVQALVLELTEEAPTHPRTVTTPWAEVTLSPELVATLAAIDHLRAALTRPDRGPAGDDRQPRPAPAAAPHHADPHADNPLSSPAARALVEAFWADSADPGETVDAASGARAASATGNTDEAMDWIEHLARQPDLAIDLDLLCHINRLLLAGTAYDYWAGRVRARGDWQQPDDWTRPRAVLALDRCGLGQGMACDGSSLGQFPADRAVGPLLDELLAWVNGEVAAGVHPVIRAALFHQRLAAIHPFHAGNGRTAWAFTLLLLWRAGLPRAVLATPGILNRGRDAGVAAPRAADRGDDAQWATRFAQAALTALQAGAAAHHPPTVSTPAA